MNVFETACPIPADTDIDDVNFINHGGRAVISRPGIHVSKISLRLSLFTFEHMYCRVTSGGTSMILAVLYRPGSRPPTSEFFEELTKYVELLSTFDLPITVTGDINIHFQNADEAYTKRLNDLLQSFGLARHVSLPTHDCGGILDVIITPIDRPQRPPELMTSTFRTTFCCPGM